MSSYNYEHFVKDFSNRTLKNYEKYQGDNEVTQLINSMLGIIIIPYELYSFHSRWNIEERILAKTSYYESVQSIIIGLMGQRRIKYEKYRGIYDNKPKITPFLNRLRNCLAHPGNGLRFSPVAEGGQNTITDVYFVDNTPGDAFVLKIDVKDLRVLISTIAKMYSEAEPSLKANAVNQDYCEVIKWANGFLNNVSLKVKPD